MPGKNGAAWPLNAGMTSPGISSGLFVAFEGGEGAGKSTLSAKLAESLRATGVEVVLTREPGGTPYGRRLREYILHTPGLSPATQLLLFCLDRRDHVTQVISPALARGAVVLCDRYLGSSIAYQGSQDLSPDLIALASDTFTGALRPDLTITLDVDTDTRRARRGAGSDVFERQREDFHDSVRASFLAQAAADPARHLVMSADWPLARTHATALVEICLRLNTRALAAAGVHA